MKKKKMFLGVLLLLAVLVLGVGYALTTTTLKVTGTATAQESATSFNVKFTNAAAGTSVTDQTDANTVLASSTASVTSDTVATMTATLTNVGNEQTVTFTVQNDSQEGVKAVLSKDNVKICKEGSTTELYSSEYFTVTTNITDDIEIASGDSTTFTVTVKLDKAVVGNDVTEKFDVVLADITAVQE